MKNLNSFKILSDNDSTVYIANCLPKGKLFINRFDSNYIIYKFLSCISGFINIIISQIYTIVKNFDINYTDELLTEYEASVKIPESTPRLSNIVDRRNAVNQLISKIPVVNINNGIVDYNTTFENYVKLLTGIDISIVTDPFSTSGFPIPFPIVFDYSVNFRQFIFKVTVLGVSGQATNKFPLPFPVKFFDAKIDDSTKLKLDNVLKKIIPVYCDWYYSI
jgi:hypothetical protein